MSYCIRKQRRERWPVVVHQLTFASRVEAASARDVLLRLGWYRVTVWPWYDARRREAERELTAQGVPPA